MVFTKIRQNHVYLNAQADILEIFPRSHARNAYNRVILALQISDLNVSVVFPLPIFMPPHVLHNVLKDFSKITYSVYPVIVTVLRAPHIVTVLLALREHIY